MFYDVQKLISIYNFRCSWSFPEPVVVVIFWNWLGTINEGKVNLLFSLKNCPLSGNISTLDLLIRFL